MYSDLTFDVMKSYLTRVLDKKIRNDYITGKQGLLCDSYNYYASFKKKVILWILHC